jgi:ferredoxin--NADP+ reductase
MTTTTTRTPPETIPATLIANKSRIKFPEPDNEIRELVIEIDQPGFQCAAGQSIGVLAPVPPDYYDVFHLRWYSIADIPAKDVHGRPNVTICVRRIVTQDPVTGQGLRGRCSNYLCDLQPGAKMQVTGPKGIAFPIPPDKRANLILIGTGTGIAPFRSFIKTLHRQHPDWEGVVRLFYGTRTGLDLLYQNDANADLQQYFDQETFDAFKALSPPPNWADPIAWDLAFSERGSELLDMMDQPNTYVYVAGREAIRDRLDKLFGQLVGSSNLWNLKKQELISAKRWAELIYK